MIKIKEQILFLVYISLIALLLTFSLLNIISYSYIYLAIFLEIIYISMVAIKELYHNKVISTELFLIIASIIGITGHEYKTISIILLIMLIAKLVESIIEMKTEDAIESLVKLTPKEVTVLIDSKEKIININEVLQGMVITVKSGGLIPVDGIIIDGIAQINEAALTGESTLKDKSKNDKVYASTFIENGNIKLKVEKVGTDTLFGKIKEKIEIAQESKAKISTITNKIASIVVPAMLIFVIIVWLFTRDIKLIITILVFGSPIELTLITPLAIISAVTAAFRNGVLIKGGIFLEELAKIDTIIFDKTGTLTLGQPEVSDIHSFSDKHTVKEILEVASMAEKLSSHPISKAVLKEAEAWNIEVLSPDKFELVSGHGININHNNRNCFIGNKHFVESPEYGNIKFEDKVCQNHLSTTVFYVGCDNNIYGKICISDKIRPEAKYTIEQLKKLNILNFYIISGDNQEITKQVAQELKIDNAFGDMFPDQKIEKIKQLQQKGHKVLMVGDGINDAPSLKQANVGIALGQMAMEPAIEAADIVLMNNDLTKILFIYKLSKQTFRIIKQNLFIGFALVHIIGIILAFCKLISPIQAALFHAVPDLAILINSIRLINFKCDS
ncbi:Cation transport ATPase [Candidatus Babela massiliensis]|uniref:Cation transport ATPase n=2 Tax=Candidatus Babela massiliensis TaxID=673862 RepID=V6DF14_9BACT|nr:Cation transport ATPase [Candidatus Babela massiliensis]